MYLCNEVLGGWPYVCGSGLAPVFCGHGRPPIAPVLPLCLVALHGSCYCLLNIMLLIGVKCKGVKCNVTFSQSIHSQA